MYLCAKLTTYENLSTVFLNRFDHSQNCFLRPSDWIRFSNFCQPPNTADCIKNDPLEGGDPVSAKDPSCNFAIFEPQRYRQE